MIKHWEHTEIVDIDTYRKLTEHNIPINSSIELPANTAVFITCIGYKRLEGIYDSNLKGIRLLTKSSAPNRDLRLYIDAINNKNITMIAVDGLIGTGKTSTCVEDIINRHLLDVHLDNNTDEDWKPPVDRHKVMISKPHVNAGGSHEQYGFLPGDVNQKLDPTLNNFIQYFDRWHPSGFSALQLAGYVEVLPMGFIRGLDAKNTTIIADECQNTRELISVASRKSDNCRIFFLGDTSPFQIDLEGNTPTKNGLTHLIDLLQGASYFQYIEMKSLEHIVRGAEVRDIVRRLYKKYGANPEDWTV